MMRRAILGLLCLLAGPAWAAGVTTHPRVCGQAATSITSDVDCADWNAAHLYGGTGAAQGRLLYYDSGEADKANWTAEVLYDETTTSLKLFGGGIGTSGAKVLSLGQGTEPTTSPADSVQLVAKDLNGAGTTGLRLRDEPGSLFTVGRTSYAPAGIGLDLYDGTVRLFAAADTGAGQLGTLTNHPVEVWVNGARKASLTAGGNLGLNATTFGTSAAGVVAVAIGTCGSTNVADQMELCVEDLAGAGTVTMKHRDEAGNVTPLGHLTATVTYDPASITAGSETSTTMTVTGAAVGHVTRCGLTTLTTQDVILTTTVSAADTVRVLISNVSGSTVDLTSGTLRCSVWRY